MVWCGAPPGARPLCPGELWRDITGSTLMSTRSTLMSAHSTLMSTHRHFDFYPQYLNVCLHTTSWTFWCKCTIRSRCTQLFLWFDVVQQFAKDDLESQFANHSDPVPIYAKKWPVTIIWKKIQYNKKLATYIQQTICKTKYRTGQHLKKWSRIPICQFAKKIAVVHQ